MNSIVVPVGSKIKIETSQRGNNILSWDKPNGGIFKYFIILFLVGWLGGWFFGFKETLFQLLHKPELPNKEFLIFWLIAWTAGGCGALFYLFLILRPQKPERVVLYADSFDYDTGLGSPLSVMFNRSYNQNPGMLWKQILKKRKVLSNLKKTEVKFFHERNPSRVYFDWENERYEIAMGLSEPDIDWLYSQLNEWSR